MPRIQPLLPLLRPLVAPRRAACAQLFRLSTAARLRAEQPPDPPSTPAEKLSIHVAPKKAPPKAPSPPQAASRAADLAAAEAATEADNPQAPAPKPPLPSKRSNAPKPRRTRAADDVQPTPRNALPGATDLKNVKPRPFKAPSNAKKPSKANATLELPPPNYHVGRSASNNLPIYTDYKRGGNLHTTTIRKISGDVSALRDELRVFLNKQTDHVKINSLTQHVVVKGHHVQEITQFLQARGM